MSSLSPCRFAYSALASILSFLDLKHSHKYIFILACLIVYHLDIPTFVLEHLCPKQQKVENVHVCTSLIKSACKVWLQTVRQFRRHKTF